MNITMKTRTKRVLPRMPVQINVEKGILKTIGFFIREHKMGWN